jgi:hypothetical protein
MPGSTWAAIAKKDFTKKRGLPDQARRWRGERPAALLIADLNGRGDGLFSPEV